MRADKKKIDELETLYHSLYGEQGDVKAFIEMILRFRDDRPDDLRQLDIKRLRDPRWYMKGTMQGVTMYTDLFAGDLRNLRNKIPYLKELGISYLHLMPLMKMPKIQNDGGYAVENFCSIDPRFGTNDDLVFLTKELRENGISLCMDFVINHTASTHEWACRAEAGDKYYQEFYMTYPDRTIPDLYEETVPEVFPTTASGNFIWNEKMKCWVFSSFYPYQWDLNYHNPEVLAKMIYSMLMMANLGVEAIRLDAVPYIWKELGTTCRNLPQVHTIVRVMRLALELAAPAVILMGEVVMAPKEIAAYFGSAEAPECHLLYGVSSMVNLWSALASGDVTLLKYHLEDLFSLPDHCAFVNYIRCHDDIGWGLDEDRERSLGIDPLMHKVFLYNFYSGNFPDSWARGQLYNHDWVSQDARSCGTTASLCGLEKALIDHSDKKKKAAFSRILLMHAAISAIKGFPLLSSGDEIGQLNDYSYMNNYDRAGDERNLHRSHYRWTNAKFRTVEGTNEYVIWHGLAELRNARKHLCFSPEAEVITWDSHSSGVLAVRRRVDRKVLLCIMNFTDKQQYTRYEYFTGMYRDLFSGDFYEPGIEVIVPPYRYLYLEGEIEYGC